MTTSSPRMHDTLDEIEADIWRRLCAAAGTPGADWRRCVVATSGPDGPEARTMVLRECDPALRCLTLYTDARSPKLAQLAVEPRAQMVFWSADINWQLRVRVRMTAETEGLGVSARWARVRFSPAAQDYLSHLAPGAPLGARPAPHPDAVAHHHFAVLTAQVEAIDWLELHPQGHRRAWFAEGERHWLTP